ncbi:hypothetical protein pEaSNUABM5_00097 [Erwinia phage pEa_SNUABM_5]|uniref:Uncharacterized protein n=1 Tax=Erwinia phage pEa_SNUABM_5 TaxID=2797313 RepID=A0A7T8EPY2_9CAUD|nr:hypothetical protein MPK73_gp097 [Erwinia phage pEa_SNUABM_5]QQO90239.1 hypothetical protein pEaSNUABM5_00097 [Erwinia phage pEa_SNUABM_5]
MSWSDVLGLLLGSNFPTFLSVAALTAGSAFFYFYVLPRLDRLKELETKEKEGAFESTGVVDSLKSIQEAVTLLAESGPVDNLDFKEGIDSIYKAMQRFERQLSTMSKDTRDGNEVQNEILRNLHELRMEVTVLRQRVQSISSALYQTTGTTGGALGDLRELQ